MLTEHFLQDFQCRPWGAKGGGGGGGVFCGIAHCKSKSKGYNKTIANCFAIHYRHEFFIEKL